MKDVVYKVYLSIDRKERSTGRQEQVEGPAEVAIFETRSEAVAFSHELMQQHSAICTGEEEALKEIGSLDQYTAGD